MIQRLFGQRALADTFDATDGVAIALCHAHQKVGAVGLGGKNNNLADQIEALRKESRSTNRFDEKLKQAGIDAKARQRLAQPQKRSR